MLFIREYGHIFARTYICAHAYMYMQKHTYRHILCTWIFVVSRPSIEANTEGFVNVSIPALMLSYQDSVNVYNTLTGAVLCTHSKGFVRVCVRVLMSCL